MRLPSSLLARAESSTRQDPPPGRSRMQLSRRQGHESLFAPSQIFLRVGTGGNLNDGRR